MRSSCGTATRWSPSRTPAETRRGLEREDLFTVVSEQFITDTARLRRRRLPGRHRDRAAGRDPLVGSSLPGLERSRHRSAGRVGSEHRVVAAAGPGHGLDDPEFDLDDEALIRSALPSVDVDLLRKQGFMRLDLPDDLLPYAGGRV